ncbi:mitochondrial 54s ribosomal protein 31 [Zalerion maritima]|uniref:Large ribosomal subunit protein mL60 n=1 Tax=Zalerion maritima TaxID=339359 RepID=A0AAD5WPV7_9PEZI|nr:mitochondrial 54s ribosomal protein 31 [Zalerion maritima]
MFSLGPFRPTSSLSGGLLWKIPWRMSKHQKRRQRLRLKAVDNVVDTITKALAKRGDKLPDQIQRWNEEMPKENEMVARDKYTMFDRKVEKTYRKGIHKLPKWTRVSQRINPPGY